MVSRSELDMLDIREIFRTKYEKSLYSMIKVSRAHGGREGSIELFAKTEDLGTIPRKRKCPRKWESLGHSRSPCLVAHSSNLRIFNRKATVRGVCEW